MADERKIFDLAIRRSKHLCFLYELVHHTRSVTLSKEAESSFKNFMGLSSLDNLLWIRGKSSSGEDSLLVIKNPPPEISLEDFEHKYASELLRSAIVSAVAALDKYMHEVAVNRCFTLLRGKKKDIPRQLKKLEVPAIAAFETAEKLRRNPSSRPGNTLKQLIQSKLHERTMQGSEQIGDAVKLMGINDFWRDIEIEMGAPWTRASVQNKLNEIVKRRNQIVHEADYVRKTRMRQATFQEIRIRDAEAAVKFIQDFVVAADNIFAK